ncbi:MAG: DUF6794 domain-containing protein [Bacteroidota bacterium]
MVAACSSNEGGSYAFEADQVAQDARQMITCDSLYKVMQRNKAMVFSKYNAYPLNFDATLISLDTLMNPFMKEWFLCLPESEFNKATIRKGLGKYLVQEWGLKTDNTLATRMYKMGILHHDDMASIILLSYQRKLKKKDMRVQEQIEFYQEFWRAAGMPVDSALRYIDERK